MLSDIERHRKSKQHLEVTITTVLKASTEGRDLLARKEFGRKPKKRPPTNSSTGGSSPKRARLNNTVKNVGENQNPQVLQGISMITQDSVRSSTCNTRGGNILLSCPDPINSVAKTVSTELESESEVEPNSKSQIDVTNFLNPRVHAITVCNATEVDSSVNL